MADSGVGSRRKCEELIRTGRVCVNGVTVTQMGIKVDAQTSRVCLDGCIISPVRKKEYIAFNKPVGYISSVKDQFGRKTVLDAVTADGRIFPVGRLDYNSSGLIFLTNDGDFAYKLTHPRHNIEKTYVITADGIPGDSVLTTLREGILLCDGVTLPAKVVLNNTQGNISTLTITVTEGRNRLIRRMMDAVGHKVLSLHRISIGGVNLGDLPPGGQRPLTDEELRVLQTESV